ncbi:MAG: hypothetical protein HY805_00275 [Nitrospirae bacterium]|nr:hypothetical protein [Nitrospirota bacterium]
MSALTADRKTPYREDITYSIGVAGASKIFAGSIVAINSSGYAVPASDTAGLRVIGRAEEQVDNSAGANGDKSVLVRKGVYKVASSGLTIADVGKVALVSDDQTISILDTTNNIVAGVIEAIDSATEAWVRLGLSIGVRVVKTSLSYKAVAVTVAASATSGSSAADADLEGGEILGIYSTGNQDQLIDSVVRNADGSVTVTLAVAAVANNTFKVVVLRATG